MEERCSEGVLKSKHKHPSVGKSCRLVTLPSVGKYQKESSGRTNEILDKYKKFMEGQAVCFRRGLCCRHAYEGEKSCLRSSR